MDATLQPISASSYGFTYTGVDKEDGLSTRGHCEKSSDSEFADASQPGYGSISSQLLKLDLLISITCCYHLTCQTFLLPKYRSARRCIAERRLPHLEGMSYEERSGDGADQTGTTGGTTEAERRKRVVVVGQEEAEEEQQQGLENKENNCCSLVKEQLAASCGRGHHLLSTVPPSSLHSGGGGGTTEGGLLLHRRVLTPPPALLPPLQPPLASPAPPPLGMKTKAKGLLERRGSSASLTIDLSHPPVSTIETTLSVTPTRECSTEEYLLSCSKPLSRDNLRSCLKDVQALHREFWDLPLNHQDRITVPGSSTKNRYKTVIPNEGTRVILPLPDNSTDSLDGYINANYIRGYECEERSFIATQGPMTNTVADLWAMAWAEDCPALVMITRLVEKGRPKCEAYLPGGSPGSGQPDSSSLLCRDISVTVQSVTNKDGYTIRHIQLQKNEEKKKLVHFWFDSWPDHKTPPNAHSLLSLAKEVELTRFGGVSVRRPSAVWLKESSCSPGGPRGGPSSNSPGPWDSPRSPYYYSWSPKSSSRSPLPRNSSNQSFFPSSPLPSTGGGGLVGGALLRGDLSPRSPPSSGGGLEPIPADSSALFSADTSPSKKRTKSSNLPPPLASSSSPDCYSTPDCFATPLDDSTAFRFSPTSRGCGGVTSSSSAEPEGVFWRFEKLSTNSTSSYDTPGTGGQLSDSERSAYNSGAGGDDSSYDSPRSKTGESSIGGSSSIFTEDCQINSTSPTRHYSTTALLSPRWLDSGSGGVPRGRPLGPVIVHCSAGIGRTGCFIAICIGVAQLLAENCVDILGIVCKMRLDRGGMVQTAEQYEFIHRALALFERSLPGE